MRHLLGLALFIFPFLGHSNAAAGTVELSGCQFDVARVEKIFINTYAQAWHLDKNFSRANFRGVPCTSNTSEKRVDLDISAANPRSHGIQIGPPEFTVYFRMWWLDGFPTGLVEMRAPAYGNGDRQNRRTYCWKWHCTQDREEYIADAVNSEDLQRIKYLYETIEEGDAAVAEATAKLQAKKQAAELEAARLAAESRERETNRAAKAQNETSLRALVTALQCERASEFVKGVVKVDQRPSFDLDLCVAERRFRSIEASRDPQAQYLAAVRYEADGKQSWAKTLYLAIMERHPNAPIALKAADRLAALTDVQAIERSNASKERAVREASDAAAKQARDVQRSIESANTSAGDRARAACRVEMDTCYSRGGKNCYRDCNSIR